MKNSCCDHDNNSSCQCNESKEVTDLPIDNKRGHCNVIDILKRTIPMGHKGHYQRLLSRNNVTQDSRSQSLPNCLVDEKNKSQDEIEASEYCDISNKSLDDNETTPPQSPGWFKTWPERYEKIKSNESSPEATLENTHVRIRDCDNVKNGRVKCKLSLNEALQNISLAYSPVTKQLHLIEKPSQDSKPQGDDKKKGHKRIQAGSFSSTISSLSDPSPSGSLLDADDRSLTSFEELPVQSRRRSLTSFFTKNVFSWKLFGKKERLTGSPLHVVASSSALIQYPRPSNLPAKTREEEQRHREEYEAMVAAARRKEAQNTAARQRLQKLQLQQEEQQAATAKHFIKHVLPNWEAMCSNKKTRDLWWQGLPSSVRGKVWRLAIGNELNVTPQLYEICVSRAQNRLNSPEPSHCDSDIDQESSMDVIQLDISRTFPHLCIFQEGGPCSDVLHSLLAAYVCYRPDVGYVQGMSYIAAILILNMEPFDAFICFANLLNQPLHLSAFTLNQEQMEAYYKAYNEVFSYNLPKLYAHFESSRLTPDLYLLDWIYTIFAKAMPLDVACRVWDIFLRDGYEFIFRTALGILHLNQDTLIDMDFLHGAQFLTRLPDDLSSDQLFKSIQSVTTSIGKQSFCQIVDKHR